MTVVVTAAAGFLLAVLWFDLMFDVQVWRHRRAPDVPEPALESIAAYYRRVTTTASPMGRLVAVVMLVLIAALVWQAVDGDAPTGVSVASAPLALVAVGLAVGRVFGRARRLGARGDSPAVQTELARSIFRDHLICVSAMATLLAVQLASS
ncbi:MAG: hypothetical protein WD904_00345 [Dehalococcoidia bacterium]